jgi:transcriptional regulator with XRE-family HTH domain
MEGEVLNLKGPRMRMLRELVGISQAELARRLQLRGWDLDIMVLNRIELGKRTLTDFEIQRILDTLGRKWADLDD